MNGDRWGGPYTHNTDFNVPDCGSGSSAGPVAGGTAVPTLVSTILEQQARLTEMQSAHARRQLEPALGFFRRVSATTYA
jgi:hypothetical protein